MKKHRDVFWFGLAAMITLLSIAAAVALYPRKAHPQSTRPERKPTPFMNAQVCAPFDKVVGALEKEYNELLVGGGVRAGSKYSYYLFRQRNGKTWTFVRTDTHYVTCFIASGTDWDEINPWKVKPQKTHAPYDWIKKYSAPSQHVRDAITGQKEDWNSKIGCCGKVDAVVIPLEEATAAHLGSEIRAKFPDGSDLYVTITAIYGTEDPEGKAWLTRYGCLFLPFSM